MHLGAEPEREPHRELDRFLVQHRQHARQADVDLGGLRVRLGAERVRRGAEQLRLGLELRVHLEADHGLPAPGITNAFDSAMRSRHQIDQPARDVDHAAERARAHVLAHVLARERRLERGRLVGVAPARARGRASCR